MTKQAYKAAALTVRALNITYMLSAYQAELFDVIADMPKTSIWEKITTIADICLRFALYRRWGKCMLVLQERTRSSQEGEETGFRCGTVQHHINVSQALSAPQLWRVSQSKHAQ